MIRALVYERAISPERRILPLCCAPATDGNRKKERGIVSQQYNHERSINDGNTHIVNPAVPGDTEYSQRMLY